MLSFFMLPPYARQDRDSDEEFLVVKRVIGLPGQQVEVRDGLVWIDGTALNEPYIAEPPLYQWGPQNGTSERTVCAGRQPQRQL